MADVPGITTAVARTLQALRADRGWSLDQLAARSGVSKGVLVALEQGRSNPNLATLARIGDAFGVPETLLVDVGGEPSVRITNPDASRVLWRGPSGGTGTIVGATDPPWAVELWRWEVMPGETFGGDAHAPATREMIWVESGAVTVTVAGERHAVSAGQCARFAASRPHRYDNEGAEPARLTMVVVIPPAQGLRRPQPALLLLADEPVTGSVRGPPGPGHV
jgi:transcriptional regulator with XRE-family HTH domain